MKSKRLRVYVAGPMTIGEPLDNIYEGAKVGKRMVRDGLAPYIPHLDAYMMWWDEASYELLLDWDFAWIEKADALYRIEGASPGADREVEFARELGIPVFVSYDALLRFAHDNDRVAEVVPSGEG